MLSPQTCCTQVDVNAMEETWWNQWFDELERFYQFHIDLIKEEGGDALNLGPSFFGASLPLDPNLASFINGTENDKNYLIL